MTQTYPRMVPVADHGVLIEFENAISQSINQRVYSLVQQLRTQAIAGVTSLIPTYRSIFVGYDALVISQKKLMDILCDLLHLESVPVKQGRRVRIPISYDDEFGMDLEYLATYHQVSVDEIIAAHSTTVYQVFMIGFMPGFAYLGPLSPLLHTPRRATPRPHTPAGSVNIGGAQTLIGSVACPSGWHVVGRTPLRLFDVSRSNPFLLAQGDEVVFDRIDAGTFYELEKKVQTQDWQPKVEVVT